MKFLVIVNDFQLAIFDTANDGEVILNESNRYFRGYFFKGDSDFNNSYVFVEILNINGAKF